LAYLILIPPLMKRPVGSLENPMILRIYPVAQ